MIYNRLFFERVEFNVMKNASIDEKRSLHDQQKDGMATKTHFSDLKSSACSQTAGLAKLKKNPLLLRVLIPRQTHIPDSMQSCNLIHFLMGSRKSILIHSCPICLALIIFVWEPQ